MSYISAPADEKEVKEWDSWPRIPQPDDLGVTLFPHQCVSVAGMERMEEVQQVRVSDTLTYQTQFGVLGDIPGYGKSFSIVGLLLRDRMPWDIALPYSTLEYTNVNQCVTRVQKRRMRRARANLIVASSSLIEQWKEYFSFVRRDTFRLKEVSAMKDLDNLNPDEWDVVLVSATRFNALIDQVGPVVWKRFIFDEAGSTHINAMRHVYAGFIWFVTATYQTLYNCGGTSHHFMRAFMSFIPRDAFKYFIIKNPTEFVQSSFRMPAVHTIRHICLNPRVLNVLSRFVDDETRLMISAGDIRGAIARVGGGTTSATNLFEIVAKRQHEKLTSARFSLDLHRSREHSEREVEFWAKRVASLEAALAELEEKYKNVLTDDCSICYSTITDPVLLPCCQNVFCGKCVMRWMETSRNTCPMCRGTSELKDLVYVSAQSTGNELGRDDEKKEANCKPNKPLQKQETVAEIVKNGVCLGKRFLIFSSYDESFYMIRRELDVHNIPFVELCGTKATRDKKLRTFREGKVSVVFLNSRFNGAGINLETATDVILYHEMPSALRDQVIGRALRIGRQSDLTIHHLVYE
jgi:hypothetical protein